MMLHRVKHVDEEQPARHFLPFEPWLKAHERHVRLAGCGEGSPGKKGEELRGELLHHGAAHIVLDGVNGVGPPAEHAAVPALESAGRGPSVPHHGEVRHRNPRRASKKAA